MSLVTNTRSGNGLSSYGLSVRAAADVGANGYGLLAGQGVQSIARTSEGVATVKFNETFRSFLHGNISNGLVVSHNVLASGGSEVTISFPTGVAYDIPDVALVIENDVITGVTSVGDASFVYAGDVITGANTEQFSLTFADDLMTGTSTLSVGVIYTNDVATRLSHTGRFDLLDPDGQDFFVNFIFLER